MKSNDFVSGSTFQRGDLLMIRQSSTLYTIAEDAPLIIESMQEIKDKPKPAVFLGSYVELDTESPQHFRNLIWVLVDSKRYAVSRRQCSFFSKIRRNHEKVG